MAQPPSAARADTGPGAEDELDDLYDYGAGMADAFREVDTNMEVAPRGGGAQRAQDEKGAKRKRATLADDLGIDEEVRVKTRAPRFKLDDNLYVTQCTIAYHGLLGKRGGTDDGGVGYYPKRGSQNYDRAPKNSYDSKGRAMR